MRPNPAQSIAVIGGGISGITTAVLLHLLGYRTVLYTQEQPFRAPDADRPPEFATLHAAASILPHSVASPKVSHWTGISQSFFRALSFSACCGVRRQVHYEVFEDPLPAPPAYAAAVDNFEILAAQELQQRWVPRRSGARQTHGWKFDAFFCEAPEYLRYLYAFYTDIGGRVLSAPGDGGLTAYLVQDHSVHVNCTGAAAETFLASAARDATWVDAPSAPDFEPLIDPIAGKLIRGHYLRVSIRQLVTGDRGQFFSYNYKPSAEIYQTAIGTPADVYCYPRSDVWILGGSRQEGRIDPSGHWTGQETVGETIEFPRPDLPPLAVPAAVLQLNADILLSMTDGELDLQRLVRTNPGIVAPAIGYRFVRDSASEGIRTSASRLRLAGAEKYVLHNYGHGGSGYTLSWGCAMEICQLVRRIIGQPPGLVHPSERGSPRPQSKATRVLLEDLAERLLA